MKFEIIEKTNYDPDDVDVTIGKEFNISIDDESGLIKTYEYNGDLSQLIKIYTELAYDLFSYTLDIQRLEYYFDSLGCDCCTEWGYNYEISIKHKGITYIMEGDSSNEEFAIQNAISDCADMIGVDNIIFYCG